MEMSTAVCILRGEIKLIKILHRVSHTIQSHTKSIEGKRTLSACSAFTPQPNQGHWVLDSLGWLSLGDLDLFSLLPWALRSEASKAYNHNRTHCTYNHNDPYVR